MLASPSLWPLWLRLRLRPRPLLPPFAITAAAAAAAARCCVHSLLWTQRRAMLAVLGESWFNVCPKVRWMLARLAARLVRPATEQRQCPLPPLAVSTLSCEPRAMLVHAFVRWILTAAAAACDQTKRPLDAVVVVVLLPLLRPAPFNYQQTSCCGQTATIKDCAGFIAARLTQPLSCSAPPLYLTQCFLPFPQHRNARANNMADLLLKPQIQSQHFKMISRVDSRCPQSIEG